MTVHRDMHSVIDNPYFVGASCLQYTDSPIIGRAHDGEDYNVGFESVGDAPCEPMVEAAKVLEMHGWQVWTCSTGEALLDDLNGHQPDCLVLDPHLPGLRGAEFARTLSTGNRCIPIIALTAGPTSQLTADLAQAGVAALLTKPVSEETLVSSIQEALNK